MITRSTQTISAFARRRRTFALGLIGLFALVSAACSVQKDNTYPIDLFTEMHYSQSNRMQEPPRLQVPAETVAYEPVGSPEMELDVPEFKQRAYDAAIAAQLYSVNCSVCHGVRGEGNGIIVAHLQNPQSYHSTQLGGTPALPPNLKDSRDAVGDAGLASAIRNGGFQPNSVMPQFDKLLSEEEIWDIVAFIQDRETGLDVAQPQ